MAFPRQTEFPFASALLDFLTHAERRPGMYFGSHDPRDVQRVLAGWQYHRQAAPDDDPFADLFFSDFHAFVADHYGDYRGLGWGGMIAERAGDGIAAQTAFMALVRAFAATRVTPFVSETRPPPA